MFTKYSLHTLTSLLEEFLEWHGTYARENLWIETPKAEQVGGQIQITANILTPTGNPVSVVRGDVITTIFGANTVTEYRGCHGF